MAQDDFEFLNNVIKTVKKAGAQESRAALYTYRSIEIEYRDRRPETIRESASRELSVDIFAGGRYTAVSTSDLREKPLAAFLGQSVTEAKLLEPDPLRTLPDPSCYAKKAVPAPDCATRVAISRRPSGVAGRSNSAITAG